MNGALLFMTGRATTGVAPLDVRLLLCFICLTLAYKLLSLDFAALGAMCARPPLYSFRPAWLQDLFTASRCQIFAGAMPRVLPVVAAGLLVATAARPSRLLALPALILVWIVDTAAYQFRFTLYTIDTPMALLALLCLVPVRLSRAARWDGQPHADAALAMLICVAYVASYYVLAGASKLIFDWRWAWIVAIGNYYPVSWLQTAQVMPDSIEPFARHASEFLRAHRPLDTIGAAVVLIEQFLWIWAPFSVLLRFHAGIFAAAYHGIVLLMTGIAFVSWIAIAIGVSVPFSAIWRRFRTGGWHSQSKCQSARRWTLCSVGLVSVFAACLSAGGAPYPPFHNYLQFGWRYRNLQEIGPFYRLGYRDPRSGQVEAIGLGHGGFMEFRHSAGLNRWVGDIIRHHGDPQRSGAARAYLETMLVAMRPPGSNGWLLGEGRHPDHLLSVVDQIDLTSLSEFLLLQGTPLPPKEGRPARASFQACGTVHFERSSGLARITTWEACLDI